MRTFLCLCLLLPILGMGQNTVPRTFKDRRIINAHSVETLPKRKLDIRIGHRFGDFLGDNGGWTTLYGLEAARDVMIGGEYGVTDNFMIGVNRTKGAGPLRQLVNGFLKYRLVKQRTDNTISFTITLLGVASLATQEASSLPDQLTSFDQFAHRLSYTTQVMLASRLTDRFSVQIAPTLTHLNLVEFGDENNLYSLGVAARWQVTKVIGLLADFNLPVNSDRSPFAENESEFRVPLGFAIEFDTGGHVFQVNFTNSEGIIEPDYLSNTTSNWGEGEFRLGFTISRLFNL